MLAWVVIYRRHLRHSTPILYLCVLSVSALSSLSLSLNHSPLSPVFRIFFQVPYPVSPVSATLAKTAGVCVPTIPILELTNQESSSTPIPHSLHPIPLPLILLRTLLRFFALSKNSTLFFSGASALFAQNTRGWGTHPLRSMSPRGVASEVEWFYGRPTNCIGH